MVKTPKFYPLTHPQKTIWYTEKFYPGTGVANIVGTMRLRKDLDFNALEQAVNYLIKYNDGLRLRILEDSLGLRQYIAPYKTRRFKRIDFSHKGGWDALLKWIEHQSDIPIQSIDSDLFEFVLFKIGEGDGVLYLKAHHTIADAWSITLMGTQINDYYLKIQQGIEPEDPHFPSYLDYIVWEREHEQSEEFKTTQEFWHEKFNTLPELTTLRPAKNNFISCESRRKTFTLSRELTTKINQYAEESGVSLFVLFLSTLGIYLHRHLALKDIVIGTPILNRPTFKEKSTVGMFIETMPVRLCVDENLSFESFALQVAAEWREMKRHRYPYELLLEDVRSKHRLTTNLYDIMLSYENARFHFDLGFETTYFSSGSDPNSLIIHVSDRENVGRLSIEIDYLAALFDEQDSEQLFDHLINLLTDAVRKPSKKLYELDLYSSEEKTFLIESVNRTQVDYPYNKTIHQLFEEQVDRTPQKTALVFGHESLTYDELNRYANRYARLLRDEGVSPGTIVGLMVDRSLEMIIGILAILKAGGAYLPLDPSHPVERSNYTLRDSGAKMVLTRSQLLGLVSDHNCIVLDSTTDLPEEDSNLKNVNNSSDLAYVLYTSGSTGKPKGVMIEHRSLANFVTAMEQEVDLTGKVVLSLTTICFDIFLFESILPLVKGLKVVIADEEQQLVPWKLKELIESQQVNIIQTTPSRMLMLTSDQRFATSLKNVTAIILGGEPLPYQLVQQLKMHTSARIFNGYGPTEATVYSTFKDVTHDSVITIGHSVANHQAYILDRLLNPVPLGFTGELYIGGAGVARGYLNRPDLTRERFVPNPFRPGETMYRTGDMVKWDKDGNIHFTGRQDHQVKIRGYRIELGEIEQVLRDHEQVAEAVVIVKEDVSGNQYLSAYLISDPGLDIASLRSYLADYLPDYMIPAAFTSLDEMPINPSGKICRKTLLEISDASSSSTRPYCEPRNEVDEILAREWALILKTSSAGIDDNFFEMGGDSLKIVRLLVALLPYNWEITVRDFYRYPTIRSLSDKIRGVGDELEWDRAKDIAEVPYRHDLSNIGVDNKAKLGNVLLTGATGYLGAHLLRDLLIMTDATVYCLIRGSSQTEAQARLAHVLDFYFPEQLKPDTLQRAQVYTGDIALPNWDMEVNQIEELNDIIDTVIHSAAKVKHYGGYEEFEKVNVNGTRSIVDFCIKGNKRLHYVSTTSVSGYYLVPQNLGDAVFTENDFYIGQHYYENVYVRSKFEAENIILHNIPKGLNATIHRIGVVAGRYRDGKFQANINDNALYNRLRSIIQLGFVQEEYQALELELSPVDCCSQAIVLLAQIAEGNRKIFHVFNPNTLCLSDLIHAAYECGYSIVTMSSDEYQTEIKEIYADPYRRDLLMGIINDLNINRSIGLQDSPHIKSNITVEYLRKLGFEWPKIDAEYLQKLIYYMESIGFIVSKESVSLLFD